MTRPALTVATILLVCTSIPAPARAASAKWERIPDVDSATLAHKRADLISSSSTSDANGDLQIVTFWKAADLIVRCIDLVTKNLETSDSVCFATKPSE